MRASGLSRSVITVTTLTGTNCFAMLFIRGGDILLPGTHQLHMYPSVPQDYFLNNNAHINGNLAFADARGGQLDRGKGANDIRLSDAMGTRNISNEQNT
jgi:hypothetical protein